MSHPRRVARLSRVRAGLAAVAASVAFAAGLVELIRGSAPVAYGLLALGAIAAFDALRSGRRATRYAVGAASERAVAEQLDRLAADGWSIRHGVAWHGRGDVDHVVEAPNGVRFAIETRTSRYAPEHLARTRDAARHVARRGHPCLPVLCLVRPRGVARSEGGVEIVSKDRLIARLRAMAAG